jgi:hypothetical protein
MGAEFETAPSGNVIENGSDSSPPAEKAAHHLATRVQEQQVRVARRESGSRVKAESQVANRSPRNDDRQFLARLTLHGVQHFKAHGRFNDARP